MASTRSIVLRQEPAITNRPSSRCNTKHSKVTIGNPSCYSKRKHILSSLTGLPRFSEQSKTKPQGSFFQSQKSADQAARVWEGRNLQSRKPLSIECTPQVAGRRKSRHNITVRAQSSDEPDPPTPESPSEEQLDWRDFRARLVAQQASTGESVTQPDDVWRTRVSKENLELLERQNPFLAKGLPWAHATGGPEVGGLVLAAHNSPLNQQRFWQAVVFLAEHGPAGSWGLILNRPSGYTIGQALPRISQTAAGRLLTVFAACPIYVGGFKSDGRSLYALHGHRLPGAQELSPGVFLGGLEVAATSVLEGKFPATDFRFFVGRVEWAPGGLTAECSESSWYTAACSKNLILKQCIQLPKPLWREVLELMGGEFAETSRVAYNESD